MLKRHLKFFTDILALPTAPYHETFVANYIRAFAAKRDLELREDRYGNIVVRYHHGAKSQPVALSGHMDHPGLAILGGGGRDLEAEWLGGFDAQHFPGSRVAIVSGDERVTGTVTSELGRARRFTIRTRKALQNIEGAFGYWDLVPCAIEGDRLTTKAADNLASCAAILAVLDELVRARADADLWGVFTRAEEVGLVGAAGIVAARTVPKKVPIFVLETSKELPGAVMGHGPVIRVGDRLSIFDAGVEYATHRVAQDLARRDRGFRFQRQLMAGGTCEASLYVLHGMTVGALAFPLGNYHNLGKRRPAPEYISLSDAASMVKLCLALAKDPPSGEMRAPMVKRFNEIFAAGEPRLLENPI